MNMNTLRDSFNASVTPTMDIEIKSYLEGYEQLCNFCTLMGTLFGFVSEEILSKMDVLRQFQKSSNKEHFKTMKSMVSYERAANLLYKSDYISGSRTLLRLHRGLGFLLMFLTKVHDLNTADSTRDAGREAYEKMLAPYHSWFVRSGASVAMYSLPTKDVLIRRIIYLDLLPDDINRGSEKELIQKEEGTFEDLAASQLTYLPLVKNSQSVYRSVLRSYTVDKVEICNGTEFELDKVCQGNATHCTKMFPEILAGMNKVYRCVQVYYEDNGLLNLP